MALAMVVAVAGCTKKPKGDTSKTTSKNPIDAVKEKSVDLGTLVKFNGQTVTIAYPWETDLTPGKSIAIDKMLARIAALEEKYDCKLEHKNIPIADYYDQMVNNTMAGNPFGDLMTMRITTFISAAKAGIMADLTNLPAYKNNLDRDLAKFAADALKVDGKYYAMVSNPPPIRSMMVFNKTLLKDANLEEPYKLVKEGKWTWDELEKYISAAGVFNADGSVAVWGLQATWGTLGKVMINSNMGDIITQNEDGKYEFVMDSPNALEALNKEIEWIEKRYMPDTEKGGAWDKPYIDFEASKAAFALTGGEWSLKRINDALVTDDFGVVHFPKGPKATQYVSDISNFDSMFIPNTTKFDKNTLVSLWIDYTFDRTVDWRENAKESWSDRTRDEESIEILLETQDKNLFRYVGYGAFSLDWNANKEIEMDPTFWQAFGKRSDTPAALIEARKSAMKAYLDDNYNK